MAASLSAWIISLFLSMRCSSTFGRMYPKNVPINKNMDSSTGMKIFAGIAFGICGLGGVFIVGQGCRLVDTW